MTHRHVDPDEVLADLKDFQRRTAVWAFHRLYTDTEPTDRFLVADEVGLGKTHIAKGVIAQVIDHLQESGDERHDIVYICSNGAIARQNLRKLVPKGIEPLEDVERLTMLPLARLDGGHAGRSGVNLLAITPGTSLKFGRNTGQFEERCLVYAFLTAHWGADAMLTGRARWIFWEGITYGDRDQRLQDKASDYRAAVKRSLEEFATQVAATDRVRAQHHKPSLREVFDQLVERLRYKRKSRFPSELSDLRRDLIGEVRRILAIVGISALRPDLVVLDEFQRFKDLLHPDPQNFAAELAHRLFNHIDPETGRPTKTLMLSATPYRMFTTTDEPDADHYLDFVATCSFLLSEDAAKVGRLQAQFAQLRAALTKPNGLRDAEAMCHAIGADLRRVMARTERLAATPDRDGMLKERVAPASIAPDDLRAYLRVGDLAGAVDHHEPTEYWKASPYLVNFMERYKLKEALQHAASEGTLPAGEQLAPGPGLLSWNDVEAYNEIDPQNGRLRWLIDDLEGHRAFDLLWMPPSLRYYDAGTVYESPEAMRFTKRLIFSGWAVVPKVVSALTSFASERRAYADRSHTYTAIYRQRGGQRLMFRADTRADEEPAAGGSQPSRRAGAMTAFLLVWPSVTLAELGDPRRGGGSDPIDVKVLVTDIETRVDDALRPLLTGALDDGAIDRRWYWAAPLLLDTKSHAPLLERGAGEAWEPNGPGEGFRLHLDEALAMAQAGPSSLGRPPDDLAKVLATVALGGPAQCALRAISASTGVPLDSEVCQTSAARVAFAFRDFFNAPEVTGIAATGATVDDGDETSTTAYWRDVVDHCVGGNLQAVLDEHAHVLRDWLGFVNLTDVDRREDAARKIAGCLAEALSVRTSRVGVDIPGPADGDRTVTLNSHSMRTRFAVPFGNQALDEGGEARIDAVSTAFNSPFWPFVLTSTSVGQEGLDFHLWCHSVVHWNLPANPVDLEQREGRVHRFKGHAVRRNIAATIGREVLEGGDGSAVVDLWDRLFQRAADRAHDLGSEMVPYWVFPEGPAKIERYVPLLPFSRDTAALPRLRKTLAAYRLAFGQPRQEELIEFLGADRTDEELLELASRLRIDLSPPVEALPLAGP